MMATSAMHKKLGAPERIRTPNPQIRSLVLYPVELRARARPRRSARTGEPSRLPGRRQGWSRANWLRRETRLSLEEPYLSIGPGSHG